MPKLNKMLVLFKRFFIRLLFALLLLMLIFLGGCQSTNEEVKQSDHTASLNIHIKDLTPPSISSARDTYTVEPGTAFDLKKEINVTDNMDASIAYEVSGELDLNKEGQYILLIKSADVSGNTATKNITVNVVKKSNPSVESSTQNNPSIDTPSPIPSPPPTMPAMERDYLYADGFDMSTAVAACQNDLSAANRTGSCTPIKDAHGVYIGMHLSLP